MGLRLKKINGVGYYYLDLNYYIADGAKKFSKYVGSKKPSKKEAAKIEDAFKSEIIGRLFGGKSKTVNVSKDELIKAALFRDRFFRKYNSFAPIKKRKYDVDSMIMFTLTTLTTEDVDVSLDDVVNAYEKETGLSQREKISKNTLNAINFIRENKKIDENFFLKLHKITMAEFETKTPGKLRGKQVYIHKRDESNPRGIEISYRPPAYAKIPKLLREFVEWYNSTELNTLEKAFEAHCMLYAIHPFLDGNKRICRLVLNKTLLDNGFPLLNISAKKEEYFRSLIKATETRQQRHFTKFAFEQYFEQVKKFLKGK